METLERFQQNRRVIEDFTERTLVAIPSDYARLLYLASLRDLTTGQYEHAGLRSLYAQETVQAALMHCHEEIFARILETRLEDQEKDLRKYMSTLQGDMGGIARLWQELEFYRVLIPSALPGYLRDLFCSNFRILLAVLAKESANVQSAA